MDWMPQIATVKAHSDGFFDDPWVSLLELKQDRLGIFGIWFFSLTFIFSQFACLNEINPMHMHMVLRMVRARVMGLHS